MSIHINSIPLSIKQEDLDLINETIDVSKLNEYDEGINFKIKTDIKYGDILRDILRDSDELFGFKNQEELKAFKDKGELFFYNLKSGVEILFVGNFPKKEAISFTNELCEKYSEITDETVSKIDSNGNLKKIDGGNIKFKIATCMKNINLIESIMENSFLGFNSQKELDEFRNKGQILTSKATNDTYDIIFMGDFQEEEAKLYVQNLTDKYKLELQELTYNRVIEKIKERKYNIESEIIDNKEAIVLTLNVD